MFVRLLEWDNASDVRNAHGSAAIGLHPRHRPAARKGRGSRARAAAGLCRPAAALQQRLPGRRERAGLARSGAGRPIPRGLGDDPARQPVAGRARSRLLSSVRDALQSGRARQCGEHPRRGALSRRSCGRAGLDAVDRARRAASACWSSAPVRAACRRPIIWPASGTPSKSATPARCPAACCTSASPPIGCRAPI